MAGLRIKSVAQTSEAYCDDINLMTEDMNDFYVMGKAVDKFEMVSGALLSRNKKCKVLGFGNWHGKIIWPLNWIEGVKSVKVFDIFISNSYQEMLQLSLNHLYQKFSEVIYAWRHRRLESIYQRVEILRIFALSRVFYVAAILPLESVFVRKFEKLVGKFIWHFSGKLLRVSIEDIKNLKLRGGLQLPCLKKWQFH